MVPVWGPVTPTEPTEVAGAGRTGPRGPGWTWAVVSLVAALIGAVVGGTIVAATDHTASSTTVKEI